MNSNKLLNPALVAHDEEISLKSLMQLIQRNHAADKQRFESNNHDISEKIDILSKILDNVIIEHDERITQVEVDLATTSSALIEIKNQIGKAERIKKSADLLFYGVPVTVNEQMSDFYIKVCANIQYKTENSLDSIFRLGHNKITPDLLQNYLQ